MSNKAKPEPVVAQTTDGKSKTGKTKETISFLSTLVPLIGVLGTAFVWAAANYYVGTVDIKPDGDYQDISVQVFDLKGSEQNFHTPHFLLQPGKYHMAINVDKKGVHHVDAEVKLGATANIKVQEPKTPESNSTSTSSEESSESRKHWWQIWKKSNPDKSVSNSGPDNSVSNSDSDKSVANSEPDKSKTETLDPDTPVSHEVK